ncbi:MAG: site-specific DNA-methyltransferase [Patescibacteria group bacterium]
MSQNFYSKLEKLLKKDSRFLDQEGDLLKNNVIDSAYKADKKLIELLISKREFKSKFFNKIKDVFVFNINDFVAYIQDKNFLADSYTKYKNKIGLNIDDKFLNQRKEVALVWPFKDCVLEGGMTKENEKRKEIFFNEILAQDEIDKLLSPKVLTNWKRYTKKGEEKVKELKRDKDGIIRENLIIKGNNLLALHSLKEQFQGQIKLIYIDPPYNTGNDSFGYNNNFNHSTWLTFMKNRLEVAKELLKDDGAILISINDFESAYLKILCDQVFNRDNYLNTLIWYYSAMSSYPEKKFRNACEHVLFYAKDQKTFNGVNRKEKGIKLKFRNVLETVKKISSSKNEFENNLKKLGIFYDQSKKDYYTWYQQSKEVKVKDYFLIPFDDVIYSPALNRNAKERVRDFNGQKPEELIKKLIVFLTQENDIILDFCLGTGTTTEVAHKMNRQYIGVEQLDYIDDSVNKLIKVINGDQSGVSKLVGWKGGGNFVYCELMQYNEQFVEKIQKTKDIKELLRIWKEMKEKSFLNYNIDIKKFDEEIDEFKKLSLIKQKHILFALLNKNQLYVNLSEIEDKEFKIDIEDKEINRKFYER